MTLMEQAINDTYAKIAAREHITAEELADALDAAADYLDHYGWIKGELYAYNTDENGYGSACAMGALERSGTIGTPMNSLERQRAGVKTILAEQILGTYLGLNLNVETVVDWNDDKASSRQEVLDAFRGASKQLRREAEGIV